MAEVDLLPAQDHAFKIKPIIREKLVSAKKRPSPTFEPEKHLSFHDYPKTLTLKDIGFPEDAGISPVAISEPFALFSEEAISHMRDEIFTTEVWQNCLHSTEFAGCQLRGHCPK